MKFRRFALKYIRSNMYIGYEKNVAIIIDPNISVSGLRYIKKHRIDEILILLTHEHFDHTNGVNKIREMFPCTLICQNECAKSIADIRKNRPLTLLFMKTEGRPGEIRDFFDSFSLYSCTADITFEDGYSMVWHGHKIMIVSSPGHSKGSACIMIDDKWMFTGDSLIPDTPVITRYPGGSLNEYNAITLPYLLNADDQIMIMPGHGHSCKRGYLKYSDGVFRHIK